MDSNYDLNGSSKFFTMWPRVYYILKFAVCNKSLQLSCSIYLVLCGQVEVFLNTPLYEHLILYHTGAEVEMV